MDFMVEFNLVDRFRLDYPGRKIGTWICRKTFNSGKSYLDRVSEALTQFCILFHVSLGKAADHKLIQVRLHLVDRPSLAGLWKFNNLRLGDTKLPGPAGIPNSAGVSGTGYWL